MRDDSPTGLEAGDFVYLTFSFRDRVVLNNSDDGQSFRIASSTPAFVNPVRGSHALMLGREAVPSLEEALVGASVGDTVSVELSWLVEEEEANDNRTERRRFFFGRSAGRVEEEEANDNRTEWDVPRLRVPPRTVEKMLPEWLATIARQENVRTPHEFVDLPAEDIADEYMLDAERIEELQSDLADEIDGWHLAECKVIDAVRWREGVDEALARTGDGAADANAAPERDGASTGMVDEQDVAATSADRWPMFGGTPALTGRSETLIPTDLPETAWEMSVPGGVSYTPIVSNTGVVVVDDEGLVVSFDPKTGHKNWSCELETPASTPPVSSREIDHVYVGSESGVVAAVGAHGAIDWRYEDPRAPYHIAVREDLLVVRTESGALYALDRQNGDRLWIQPGFSNHGATLVDAGENLLTRSAGQLRVLDPETGEMRASVDGTGSQAAPTGVRAAAALLTGDHTGVLARSLRVDEVGRWDISEIAWRTSLSGPVTLTPAVADPHVVVITPGTVHALDYETGEEVWSKNHQFTIRTSPVTDSETVLVGSSIESSESDNWSSFGAVYALNATDGSVRWNIRTDDKVLAPPAIANETVFVADAGGNVVAYR